MKKLPSDEYYTIKQEIISNCRITNSIWRNWLSGRTSIPLLAEPIIQEIIDANLEKGAKHNLQYALDF